MDQTSRTPPAGPAVIGTDIGEEVFQRVALP
jgi:hypothetical protein